MINHVVDMHHYSLSNLSSLKACAYKWGQERLMKNWPPRKGAKMLAGIANENVVNLGILVWQAMKKILTKGEAADIIWQTFSGEWGIKFEEWSDEEQLRFFRAWNATDVLCDEAIPALRDRVDQIQVDLRFPIGRFKFVAKIDYTMIEKDVLVDFKAPGQNWPEGKELESDQAFVYPLHVFQKYPEIDVVKFEFHIVAQLATPKYYVRQVQVDREMNMLAIEREHEKIVKAEEDIDKYNRDETNNLGIFQGNKNSFYCSRNLCHCWKECEKQFKWTIKEGRKK